MCVYNARAEKRWMARYTVGMATTWQGGGYTSRNGRVGATEGSGERRGWAGGGEGRREWREGGGGREQSGGERAERELTPLPRHQIASFSPLSPSRGSVSAAASPLPPPPPGRRKETCRGWRVGVGQGSEGEREFIIGGVRMRGGGPRARRGGGGGGGKWRARWKKERRSQKKEEKRGEAAGKRGDEEICYPQDSSLHARHRVVRAHTERGFSSTSYRGLRSSFPAARYFPFLPFTFYLAPPLARMLVFTC